MDLWSLTSKRSVSLGLFSQAFPFDISLPLALAQEPFLLMALGRYRCRSERSFGFQSCQAHCWAMRGWGFPAADLAQPLLLMLIQGNKIEPQLSPKSVSGGDCGMCFLEREGGQMTPNSFCAHLVLSPVSRAAPAPLLLF